MVAPSIKTPNIGNADKPGLIANPGTLTFNSDSNLLEYINSAGFYATTGVISDFIIFVNSAGNDFNPGTIDAPLLTYEAARLLAVSRNPQYGSAQVIIVTSPLIITGDMTISPYVSVLGMGLYSTTIGVTGNLILGSGWGTTAFPYIQIVGIDFVANSIAFTYPSFQDESLIRFERCAIQLLNAGPTATIIGSNGSGDNRCETIIFDQCTLDLQLGIPEPQYITTDVNAFFYSTSVSNIITSSVTSSTVQAILLVQNAIDIVGNITLNATSTGTLTTQITSSVTRGSTLTVNGTSNTVNIDPTSYQFSNFVFSGGASFSNINGGIPLVLYIDQLNGNDNNSGTINYPMQNYNAARLKAIANLGANLTVLGCTIIVIGNQNVTGDIILTPGVSIEGYTPYVSGFQNVTGNVILDPSWGTNASFVQVRNVYMFLAGTNYIFNFPAIDPSGSSFLKFVNCQFNVGGFITITGFGAASRTENVTFENCTLDFLNYTPGFTAENVNLYLINTDLSVSDVTLTASTANANNYILAINDARFYTHNIDVITNNTSTLTTYINACNTMGRTLTIDGANNTVNVDSTSYMFTLVLAGGATLANLNLPTKTDGMTNSTYSAVNYIPSAGALFGANTLTGNLKGIDNALPKASGSATLVGGTVTVASASVANNDSIDLTCTAAGGAQGFITVTYNPGVSFTLTSSSALDTSTYKWKNLGA